MNIEEARILLEAHGQAHVLRFYDELNEADRKHLLHQIAELDFPLIERLVREWVTGDPPEPEDLSIEPVSVIPVPDANRPADREAWEAGEQALRDGRVGLVLVAGGQGTRLGYDGPKGTFPIGSITGRTLFQYHADKILNAQRRYGCVLPWYIMVGETNEEATKAYFEAQDFFGLGRENVYFFKQRMMPSVNEEGKLFLESKSSLMMNPNGHGGCIPALVENGILADARKRGVDLLSYFQIDNWAVRVADPYFIGYHLLREGEMSSKVKRKTAPRESSGVFCRLNGKAGVIEYTELDIYPQLLDQDDDGELIYFAANAAIHMINVDFIERMYKSFDEFLWHCSHKKISYLDETGNLVTPDDLNGYKFETFVFDALVYAEGEAMMLEIDAQTEFAQTKQMTGQGSVDTSRAKMTAYWSKWLEAAGCTTPLDSAYVEISPAFAFSQAEFVERSKGLEWPESGPIAIGPDGEFL